MRSALLRSPHAYARAPEVTRQRLYIDTMETILSRTHKIIIDAQERHGNHLSAARQARRGDQERQCPDQRRGGR